MRLPAEYGRNSHNDYFLIIDRHFGIRETLYFRELLLDSAGRPHYLAEGSWEELLWDMTQIHGNAWAIREIEKPQGDWPELITMFLRHNGNFILLAKETGKIEPELYYTEISSEQ